MCLAIPGRIVEIDARDPAARVARVEFDGLTKSVHLVYLPEANVGDYVLVHAGFATQRLPEEEALEALRYAREMSAIVQAESARALPTPAPPAA